MKILKYTSRRSSLKKRKSHMASSSLNRSTVMHPVNPKAAFYPFLKQKPTAFIRNGVIGSGDGPGSKGLYQVDDRIYTTTKMFIRDGYMYPRQAGQTMDPRFPYELHEFPSNTGATGLQLVSTPKVHISGEYLANGTADHNGGSMTGMNNNMAVGTSADNNRSSLTRRDARKAAAEINLANQVYWLQKQRMRSRSNSLGQHLGQDLALTNAVEHNYIRNVDDLLVSLQQHDEVYQVAPSESGHSIASARRKKKVSINYEIIFKGLKS